MKENFISNIKGFSLLQVLIAAGLLGGLMMAFISYQKLVNDSFKRLDDKLEIFTFESNIRKRLTLQPDSCTQTLLNLDTSSLPTDITAIKDNAGNNLYDTGTKNKYGNFTITSIKALENDSGVVAVNSTGIVDLQIILTNKKGRDYPIRIPTFVFTNGLSLVTSCDGGSGGQMRMLSASEVVLTETGINTGGCSFDLKRDHSISSTVVPPNATHGIYRMYFDQNIMAGSGNGGLSLYMGENDISFRYIMKLDGDSTDAKESNSAGFIILPLDPSNPKVSSRIEKVCGGPGVQISYNINIWLEGFIVN